MSVAALMGLEDLIVDALHLLLWLMGMAFLLVRIILTMDGGSMDLIILSVASNL